MILLVLVLIIVIAMIIEKYDNKFSYRIVGTAELIKIIACVILGILLFYGIILHISYQTFPTKVEAVRATINEARKNDSLPSTFERAALTKTVIAYNSELAGIKYWNKSIWFGWMIPDKAADVEYLK